MAVEGLTVKQTIVNPWKNLTASKSKSCSGLDCQHRSSRWSRSRIGSISFADSFMHEMLYSFLLHIHFTLPFNTSVECTSHYEESTGIDVLLLIDAQCSLRNPCWPVMSKKTWYTPPTSRSFMSREAWYA